MDDDGGTAVGHIHLLSAVDVQVPEVGLELVVGSLKVEQSLRTGGEEERGQKREREKRCEYFSKKIRRENK